MVTEERNAALVSTLRSLALVLQRPSSELTEQAIRWCQSEIDKAIAKNAQDHEPGLVVRVSFSKKEMAEAWMSYMCDGGGEYGFMETDAGQNSSFDYDFKAWRIFVTE